MAIRRARTLGFLAALALTVLPVAACTSGSATTASTNLPSAPVLLSSAGKTMAAVHSVHFDLTVHGTLSGVPVQSATGDLNAEGEAKGSAKISEFGQLLQVDFVLVGKNFYLKGATGGYTTVPASLAGNLFDPSAILDPNRGIAKLVSGVRGAQTVAREQTDGIDCYRITGSVDKAAVASLVPGLNTDVKASVWVSAANGNQPVKAEFTVPGADGSQGATVDVDISKVNEPVSVTAPA